VGLKVWLMATRPRTLVAAVVPVLVGTAVVHRSGQVQPLAAGAALLGALLIQVFTNLVNDYYDFVRGADTAERVGPTRVTQAGLVAPRTVITAAGFVAFLAVLSGIYLVYVGGWPIVAVGVASLLAGYAYTGGPFPLGYNGLGDLFVFLFFGLVAVLGTVFVQAHALPPLGWWCAVPVGALCTNIIVVNNLRDVETDTRSGKRTLAVKLGVPFVRAEYTALLLLSFAVPVILVASGLASAWALLPLLSLPLALGPLRMVWKEKGAILNQGLGHTARLQAVFGVLLAIGLW
jgi:1,4-dihydroxy-2-naphthoate octaprenyltransferase